MPFFLCSHDCARWRIFVFVDVLLTLLGTFLYEVLLDLFFSFSYASGVH